MKKIILTFIIIVLGFSIFYYFNHQAPITSHPLPSPQPKQTLSAIEKLNPILVAANTYYYASILIDEPKDLHFYSNLTDQLSSLELIEKHNCSILVNGGFYDKNFMPLGWLISDGQLISKPITSQLFNGYLSISGNNPSITSFPPPDVSIGLQTGPLLIQNTLPLPLEIRNDEPRRRLVATITSDQKLLFIAITQNDSLFQGPLLADTPIIVNAIANKLEIPIIHAINLDGGSASTFYNDKVHLKEFSPIGSFFCL